MWVTMNDASGVVEAALSRTGPVHERSVFGKPLHMGKRPKNTEKAYI
jgi:hypothetical protein